MDEEMHGLYENQTRSLSSLPKGKRPVGCRWVFFVKHNPDGSVTCLKARLVAKGYTQCSVDYSIYVKDTIKGILLAVYVDDIILTGNDAHSIQEVKNMILLSQRKYILDLLEEIGMKGYRPVDIPMDAREKLCATTGEDVDTGKYQRLMEK
ncbi:uncharacterized mitochondrial protein AtMg00820-like [Aristolochia californica]|uniref:uncharacterized mitochondrial protein AtMg00820-like n=1 Tax=Aristolochia californica TaxID=171875 RepID=UPI0035DBFB8D